jgi:hypothetical protein
VAYLEPIFYFLTRSYTNIPLGSVYRTKPEKNRLNMNEFEMLKIYHFFVDTVAGTANFLALK